MAHPEAAEAPFSGSIPYVAGMPSLVRIPVPGTQGLAVEFWPRGWIPRDGSTSTLFIQDEAGRRVLRLDHGYNTKTQTIDYHWNQKGTHNHFQILDHAPASQRGQTLHRMARYYRWGGRLLVVSGLAIDAVSIVVASKPLRRASEVAGGWAGAWMGCKSVGALGAAGGTLANPGIGTAVGAAAGCVLGGGVGYWLGSEVGGAVYDWAEGTLFTPLPEVRGHGR
jgi:hypothetical protein